MLDNDKRYIDANMLYNDMLNGMAMTGYQSRALSIIERQPNADVQEIKHGKWVGYKYKEDFYSCSICGRSIECPTYPPNIKYPYCHCGAKMDGEGS